MRTSDDAKRSDYSDLRIVLLSGTLQLSGSTTWILGLQSAFRQLGCPVIHIVAGERSDVHTPQGHEIYYTRRARSNPLLRLMRLLQCHKIFPAWYEKKADTVLSRRIATCLATKAWSGRLDLVIKDFTSETPSYFDGYRIVSVIHQMLSPGWQDPKLRFQARPDLMLAAVSQTSAEDAREMGLKVPYILYNPLDQQQIRERGSAFSVADEYILYVGALSLGKGVYELLEAYQRVQLKLPLWIIGRGPELGGLQARVQQLELQEQVRFLGFQANPYPYIASARLLVLPSRRQVPGRTEAMGEAMGYVCLEAATLGTPFLVSDFAAAAEFYEDRTRIAFDPEDSFTERLGEAMANAIQHPASPGLRDGVLQRTDPKAVARSYLALISP